MATPRTWEHIISANFTRPNDTTAYGAGDLVANNTTAGSVAMMDFAFPDDVWLRRVRIHKSGAAVSNASFGLWLHTDSAVTFANGDNGALSTSGLAIADIIERFDVTVDAGATGLGALGHLVFDRGLYRIPAQTYGFLEATAAYTPAAQEVFTVTLYGESY